MQKCLPIAPPLPGMVLKKRDSLQNFVLCPPPSTPLLSTSGFSLSCCCLHRSTTKVSRSQFGIDDGSAQPRKVAMLPKQTHKRLGGEWESIPPNPYTRSWSIYLALQTESWFPKSPCSAAPEVAAPAAQHSIHSLQSDSHPSPAGLQPPSPTPAQPASS